MDVKTMAMMARNVNLVEYIGKIVELKHVSGSEYQGPCPFCGGTDRFRVFPDHFFCRPGGGHCGRQGDGIEFVREHDRLTFAQACEKLSGAQLPTGGPRLQPAVKDTKAPDFDAAGLMAKLLESHENLLANNLDAADQVLTYLAGRGITLDTIRAFRLGYQEIGLPNTLGRTKRLAVMLPWLDEGGELVAVKYRFLEKHDYKDKDGNEASATKTSRGPMRGNLFGLQALRKDTDTLIVVEGEINCMSIWQATPYAVVSLGSESIFKKLPPSVIDLASQYPRVITWADTQESADLGAEVLGGAALTSPQDANEHLQTGDLAEFIEANLPEPKEVEERGKLSEKILGHLDRLGYDFRWNELDDSLEINGKPMDDGQAAVIRTQFRDMGYGIGKGDPLAAVEDTYKAHAYQNKRYHPFKDYFNNLTWDGISRFDELAKYVKDDHPLVIYSDGRTATLFSAFFRRWMIGAIAKLFESGRVRGQNPMLVLDGDQGIGKSTFTRWSSAGLEDYFIEESVKPDDKEHNRYLASKFIWEVAELGATTRRTDREALKAFITKGESTFRKPFDRHAVTKPALASFIGTINNEAGFLTDTTGNRRFLTVHLTAIDQAYMQAIDPNQLWAEAYHLYQNGESWQLDEAERKARDASNGDYQVEDTYAGWILKYFFIEAEQDGEDWPAKNWQMSTAEIAQYLGTMGVKDSTATLQKGISITLKGLGLRQHANARPRVWMGIKKRPDLEPEQGGR